MRIPLIPKLLQVILSEISNLSLQLPNCNIQTLQKTDTVSLQLVVIPQVSKHDTKLSRPAKQIIKSLPYLSIDHSYQDSTNPDVLKEDVKNVLTGLPKVMTKE